MKSITSLLIFFILMLNVSIIFAQDIQFAQPYSLIEHPNQNNPNFNYPFIALDHNDDKQTDLFVTASYQNSFLFTGMESQTYDTLRFEEEHPLKAMDIDNDGDQDIILRESVLINHGQDSFSSINFNFESLEIIVEAADFNGDDFIDLIVLDKTPFEHFLYIYLNNGDNSFSRAPIGNNNEHEVIGIADMDSDGDLDIVSLFSGASNTVGQLLLNDGTGNFSERSIKSSEAINTNSIDLKDFDGDGDLDIMVHNNSEIIFLENTSLYLLPTTAHVFPVYQFFNVQFLQAADLNLDGFTDILALGRKNDKLIIASFEGNGSFELGTMNTIAMFPYDVGGVAYPNYFTNHVYLYDYNFDGKQDILYTDGMSDTSRLYFIENSTLTSSSTYQSTPFDVLNTYPNPAQDQLHILDAPYLHSEQIDIRILDALGNIVMAKSVNSTTIDISHLLPGKYSLVINSPTQAEKFYISHFIKSAN